VPPTAEWVTCGYCRVSSFVQRTASRAPAAAQVPAGAPVIHVQQGTRFLWVPIVLVALATVVVAFVALGDHERLGNVALMMTPVLFDVNDDGAEDVVVIGLKTGGLPRHLRALDANTGATLWKTDDLGTDVRHIALVGDAVLWITASQFRGFDARTGVARFEKALPEHAMGVCQAGSAWLLLTADKKVHAVDPGTGVLTPRSDALLAASGEPSCSPGWSTFAGFGRLVRTDQSSSIQTEGMATSTVLHFGDGTLPALVLGSRKEGSAIPMLAGVRDGRTIWKLELPTSAPLEVESGDPTAGTIAGGRVYASYQRTSTQGFTVVSVALSDGQRHWEAAVHRERNANVTLRASERHVFARADFSLYALSVTDGRVLWRVGWDPGAD
jgi:outer membrane protein assembly factor BamB